MSLKDTIFAVDDISKELLTVPEWGLDVEIRSMSVRERTKAMQSWTASDGEVDLERFYPAILAASVYDPETGEKVFDETDVEKLIDRNAAAIERIARVATRLSGMGPEAVDEAGEGS